MRRTHWIAIDWVVGAIITLSILASLARSREIGQAAFPIMLLVAMAAFFPVALRRLAPVVAFGSLISVAVITTDAAPAASASLFLAAAYVLYTLTVVSDKRTGAAALVLGLTVLLVVLLVNQKFRLHGGQGGSLLPNGFAMVICWMIGYSVRQRRLYAQTIQEQATSSAVAEERLRIARELHDVVAHSMAVIAVQAGYGQYVIDASPADARDALGAIQATSRDALEEMRRMLGVLRQQDYEHPQSTWPGSQAPGSPATSAPGAEGTVPGPPTAANEPADSSGGSAAASGQVADGTNGAGGAGGTSSAGGASGTDGPDAGGGPAPLAPAPGLADLARLVKRTCGAGVRVTLEISGCPRRLPASLDLSAYRIIQEALTNVVKHAGTGAACAVSVSYTDADLIIGVTDNGRLPTAHPSTADGVATGPGHGIIGMRERVHLCGGTFHAGPLPGHGFRVTATLPMPAAPGSVPSSAPGSGSAPGGGSAPGSGSVVMAGGGQR